MLPATPHLHNLASQSGSIPIEYVSFVHCSTECIIKLAANLLLVAASTFRAKDEKISSKMSETEEDTEASLSDVYSNTSNFTRSNTEEIDETVSESRTPTGVGVVIEDDEGNERTIDEASWVKSPTATTSKFALIVSWTGGDMQLTVQSRFLVSAIMKILPRADSMGVRKQHDSLTFDHPFSPLYWFYDKIFDAASAHGTLNADDSRDVMILQRWYERHLLVQHVDIRNTINSGYVTWDLLWALYRPNDIVYARDDFQQPRLHIVSSTEYVRDEENYVYPNGPRLRGNFRLHLLHQDWDSSLQVFKIRGRNLFIDPYTGSRRITDLELYPLQYCHEGRQPLLTSLEARGRRWKSLITQPTYKIYKGPAILAQLDENNNRRRKHVSPHSFHMVRSIDSALNQIEERLIIDHSGYVLYGEQQENRSRRQRGLPPMMRPPPEIKFSLNIEDLEDLKDQQGPSEPFSALQAQLCPATVNACSPLTMEWFEIAIENATEMVWQKDSADALVMADPKNKDTVMKLIQAHQNAKLGGMTSDVIEGKGQVKFSQGTALLHD